MDDHSEEDAVPTFRFIALLVALALGLAACQSGEPEEEDPEDASAPALSVAVASFDVSVGEEQRLMAGLFSAQQELLAFGDVTFQLGFLGDEPTGAAELAQETQASFLPVPGLEPTGESASPILLTGQPGSGVYAATVTLDSPGFWGLRVVAELADGTTLEGTTSFLVQEESQVPDVGDEAPRSENLTIADVEAGTVEPVAVDSRAQDPDDDIPDPHLHDSTIAEALEAARPLVAVFSTPVYCQSRFCGPLVDVISEMAMRYEDRAEFIMVEVWEDFDANQLNATAAAWIQTETGGNEPWVFLVDADGVIRARWDNVLDVDELEGALEALPATPRLD